MPLEVLRIGSRSSPMAMAQVARVRRELAVARPELRTGAVGFTTAGDRWSGSLSRLGGKGAFSRELDDALLRGEVDVAVHCVKDLPGDVPPAPGTLLAVYLTRDEPRDALVLRSGLVPPGAEDRGGPAGLPGLPPGAVVGTSAVRRVAQLARHHPALSTRAVRGNVNSRLERLDAGEYDALVLGACGLARIGAADRIAELPTATMLPAVGAGTLVVQCREDDARVLTAVRPLDDPVTRRETEAERALLRRLRGHCNSPIAALGRAMTDGTLSLRARVFSLDGERMVEADGRGGDPDSLGTGVAGRLLADGAMEIMGDLTH
ncbi:hydroxymethylbilane synthase [Streptomyces sp. SM12]|uniref:hydroxymethylbilane synthase n=1 Tax=Streptomyces sp. SM12 TaxID=1071602 RepID=UPI000CD5A9E7|nr:hydroxymethylbilane synthase [Streptomyces sp. SM12]